MSTAHQLHHQGRLRTRVAVFVCILIVAIGLDQFSKQWALSNLDSGKVIEVIPGRFSLKLLHNPGATLGMGASATWVISIAAIIACIVLSVLSLKTVSIHWTVALSIATAGAAGNLIDRIVNATGFLNGTVTDFLDYGWSIGNLADIFLTLAAVYIILLVLFSVPFSTKSQSTKNYPGLQNSTHSSSSPKGRKKHR